MKRIVLYLKIKIVSLKKHHDGEFIIEKSRKLSRYRKKHVINTTKKKIVKAPSIHTFLKNDIHLICRVEFHSVLNSWWCGICT